MKTKRYIAALGVATVVALSISTTVDASSMSTTVDGSVNAEAPVYDDLASVDTLRGEVIEIKTELIAEAIEAKAEAEQNAGTVTATNGGNAKTSNTKTASNKTSGNTNSNAGGNTNGNTTSTSNASTPAATGNAGDGSAPAADNGGSVQQAAAPVEASAPAPAPAPTYDVPAQPEYVWVGPSAEELAGGAAPVVDTGLSGAAGGASSGGGISEAAHTETVQVGTTAEGEAVYAEIGVGQN